MKNTFAYRHFLICNKIANDMLRILPQNFAQLIIEENSGRIMNSQMTNYFKQADRTICELIGNEEEFMWEDLNIDNVSELTIEQILKDYDNFCCGKIQMSNDFLI